MTPRLLIANPSADLYGSDLQMLESVTAAVDHGWQVTVTTPTDGPLVPLLEARGATVRFLDYPVVRREDASLRGVVDLASRAARAIRRIRSLIRELGPDVAVGKFSQRDLGQGQVQEVANALGQGTVGLTRKNL